MGTATPFMQVRKAVTECPFNCFSNVSSTNTPKYQPKIAKCLTIFFIELAMKVS